MKVIWSKNSRKVHRAEADVRCNTARILPEDRGERDFGGSSRLGEWAKHQHMKLCRRCFP